MKQEEKNTGQRRWKLRKSLIGLIIIALLSMTVGVMAYWWTGAPVAPVAKVRPEIEKVKETEPLITLPNKLNIILLGVDERPKDGDPGRSDTLLVMMLDTTTRKVSIISIPRDTRARVQGLGWDKINHAFAAGGVSLTQQTTENFLGIPMDYYVKVDLKNFGRVIDAVGGVTIDVEKRMKYEDTWDHFVIDLKPGVQHLDGRTALQYVRYRDEEGDIGRVRRQQKFITAMLSEMSTPSIILKLPNIIREVLATLDTDIPLTLMLDMARQLKSGLSVGIKTHMVEGLPYYINDISYWVPDMMKTRQMVSEMQGIPFSGNALAAAQKLTDEYRRNLPANAHLDNGSDDSAIEVSQVKPAPVAEKQTKPAVPAIPATQATAAAKPAIPEPRMQIKQKNEAQAVIPVNVQKRTKRTSDIRKSTE